MILRSFRSDYRWFITIINIILSVVMSQYFPKSDYLRKKTLKLMHKTTFFLLYAWRNVVSWPLQTIFIHYSGIRNTQCLTNLYFITNCTVYFTQTLLNINTCTLFACIIRLDVRYNRCREVSSVNTIWVFDLKQTL